MNRQPLSDRSQNCAYTMRRGRVPSASDRSAVASAGGVPVDATSSQLAAMGVYGPFMIGRVYGSRPQSASVARSSPRDSAQLSAVFSSPSQPAAPPTGGARPRPHSSNAARSLMMSTRSVDAADAQPAVLCPTPPRRIVVGLNPNAGEKCIPDRPPALDTIQRSKEDAELGIISDSRSATPHLLVSVPANAENNRDDGNAQSILSPLPCQIPRPITPTPVTPMVLLASPPPDAAETDAPRVEGTKENPAAPQDVEEGGKYSTASQGAGGHTSASAAFKALRDAGSAVVALARLQRVMPWATLDSLSEKGINVNHLDKMLDKFVRFTYLARGKLLKNALRRNRPALNPAVEWEQFVRGSDVVISSYAFVDAPLLGPQEEKGDAMRKVDFTASHMVFHGWGRVVTSDRRLAYRELSGIDFSPSQKGCMVATFKLWSEAPVRIKFGPNDAPSLIGLLSQRMSHNFFKGTSIVSGLMRKTIRIIHFNDVYHLEPFKNPNSKGLVGGASRFFSKVREIQKYHNPLILFSGDFMSPSLMSVLMKGKHMVDAFNLIGVHYGTFGNHEFDYGMQALTDAVHGTSKGHFVFAGSNTRWLMSNMTAKDGTPLGGVLQQDIIIWNGVRVGLLGLSENWLPQCGQLKKDDWVYHDSVAVGERLAADMKANAGVEIVIALCHNRLSKDYELAAGCPSIDLILGGHDHFYKNAPAHRTIKSGEEFEFLTEIEMIVDREAKDGRIVKYRSNAHPITSDIEPHPSMEAIVERYEGRLASRMGKVIGVTSVPLDLTESCCRFKEGLASGFIVDVMADRAKADFAVLGGAAISGKSVKPPGDITIGDIFSWFPNNTLIMTVKLKGSTVKKMLDVMVREVPNEAQSFPHPSRALSFTINTMRTPATVQDIRVNGEPIGMDTEYVVAVEDFVGLGKAKYKFVPIEGETLCDDEAAEQITYWIIDYFEKELDRAPKNTEKHLKLLTNIAMRDKLFGISAIRQKMETESAAMSYSNSSLLAASDISAMVSIIGDGIAASIITESSRFAAYQRARLETVYFELETSLKRLVPCEQVRVFHMMPGGKTAWYRTNSQGARRVTVSIDGTAVGELVAAKKGPRCCLQGRLDDGSYTGCFKASVEGILDNGGNTERNFMCLPIYFDKSIVCVVMLTNRIDGTETCFSVRDTEAAALFLSQVQPVITFAITATEREEEEDRRKTMVTMASDLVQSEEDSTVNDKIVKVGKYAKELFRVEKAIFYVYDHSEGDLWTVRRSVNTQKQTEDVILRKSLDSAPTLASALRLRTIARFAELDPSPSSPLRPSVSGSSPLTGCPRSEKGYSRNALVIPVDRVKEKGDLCGVLFLADSTVGGFTQSDERLATHFAPFIAVAIDTSSELEVLRSGIDRSKLRPFPVHELNRIRFKRGWGSVRARLSYIASDMFKEKHGLSSFAVSSPSSPDAK